MDQLHRDKWYWEIGILCWRFRRKSL